MFNIGCIHDTYNNHIYYIFSHNNQVRPSHLKDDETGYQWLDQVRLYYASEDDIWRVQRRILGRFVRVNKEVVLQAMLQPDNI